MIKVLIVDDSALVREAARQILAAQPGIQVLESFRPTSRLMSDSARSPAMPNTPTITP